MGERDKLLDVAKTIQYISDRWLSEQLGVLRITINSWQEGKRYPKIKPELDLYMLLKKHKYKIYYLNNKK